MKANIQRIVSTKPRRTAEAQEAFSARKGKRNKPEKFDYKRNSTQSFADENERTLALLDSE